MKGLSRGRSARQPARPGAARPHRVGGATLLPGRALQGRDRRGVRAQPLQGGPAARRRAQQRARAHRDRPSGRRRRRAVRPADGGARAHPLRRHRHAGRPPRQRCASISGRAAAELLTEIVTPDDVLGLSWARSVSAMAGALRVLAPVPVVQLTGALARPGADDSSIELVREVARVAGGPAYFFYAPMAVPDPTTARGAARAARGGPGVRADRVGDEGGGGGRRVGAGAVDAVRRHAARPSAPSAGPRGVCAEVSGVLIDGDGEPVPAPLTERMIGITAAQMRAVPEVIGIVYGLAKARAVLAAVRGGYVDSLVTHSTLATGADRRCGRRRGDSRRDPAPRRHRQPRPGVPGRRHGAAAAARRRRRASTRCCGTWRTSGSTARRACWASTRRGGRCSASSRATR